jgi:hypothetical protein
MKRSLMTFVGSLACATTLVVAQRAQQPAPSDRRTPDITVTGCLIQGSGPSAFILDRARLDPESTTEKGKTYLLVASAREVDLPPNLNHEVRVSGMADPVPATGPAPGQKIDEDQLPRFRVKILLSIADRCS